MKIILGSASPRRAEILKELGFEFEVAKADIDEKSIRSNDPKELSLALAKAKAENLRKSLSPQDAILITADQVVVCNGEIREKPASTAEARSWLESYAKYPAQCVNALAVTDLQTGRQFVDNDISTIYFKPIPKEVIEQILTGRQILDCAGAFTERHPLLKPYVDRIEGDPYGPMGVPRDLLLKLLKRIGREQNLVNLTIF